MIQHYLSQYKTIQSQLNEPAWLKEIRLTALTQFEKKSFPTVDQENWRFTNVKPVADRSFLFATEETREGPSNQIKNLIWKDHYSFQIVFVNGKFSPEFSNLNSSQSGIKISSLSQALQAQGEWVQPYLSKAEFSRSHGFLSMNTSLFQDGVFIHLGSNIIVDQPIHILFVHTDPKENTMALPRILIVLESGAQARVAQTYVGFSQEVYLTNTVSEIFLKSNASLHYLKSQEEGSQAFHISNTQVQQDQDSRFIAHSFSFGGKLSRDDLNVVLNGTGCVSELNGLYMTSEGQHMDHHTLVDHVSSHCMSKQTYKGVLAGKSKAIFDGKIIVRKDAQKTDAVQLNKNLLLSNDAWVQTKPDLEIFANDVKCKHGATVGQLSLEALFYLRSRGIHLKDAKKILVQAFAQETVDSLPSHFLREKMSKKLKF